MKYLTGILNTLVIASCVVSVILHFRYPPSLGSDQHWTLEMARNAAKGNGFFSFAHQWQWGRFQYPIDEPVPTWVTRWPPGMALLLFPGESLRIPTGVNLLLISALTLIIGILGWRALIMAAGMGKSDLRWVVYAGVLFVQEIWRIVPFFTTEHLLWLMLPWFAQYCLHAAQSDKVNWAHLILFGVLVGLGFWLKYSWLPYGAATSTALIFALRKHGSKTIGLAALLVAGCAAIPILLLYMLNVHYTGHFSAQAAGAVPPQIAPSEFLHPIESLIELFRTRRIIDFTLARIPFTPDYLSEIFKIALISAILIVSSYLLFHQRRQVSNNIAILLIVGGLGWIFTYMTLLINTIQGHGEVPSGDNLLIGSHRFYFHALLILWLAFIMVADRMKHPWQRRLLVGTVLAGIIVPNLYLQVTEAPRYMPWWNFEVGQTGIANWMLRSDEARQLAEDIDRATDGTNDIILGTTSWLLVDVEDTLRYRIWLTDVTNYNSQPICFSQPGRLFAVIFEADLNQLPLEESSFWEKARWMGLDSQQWQPVNTDTDTSYRIFTYLGNIPLCQSAQTNLRFNSSDTNNS